MRLAIDRVSKAYRGDIWGLRDFSIDLEPGVLGLLGPNGAGKTTLMNILATVTRPTRGTVTWNGTDIARSPDGLRNVLGYLPQDFGIYPNLNPVEFLEYIAALKGIRPRAARARIDELLRVLNLADVRKRPIGGLSGGMRQRCGIAQALVNDPRLLIVDEPTAGLDPEERARFRGLLSELSGERIVILSTHIVSDVEAIATRIALIHTGRLVLDESPEALLQRVEGRVWTCTVASDRLAELRQRCVVSGAIRRSDGVHVRAVSERPPTDTAQPTTPTVEDAYLFCIASAGRELAGAEQAAR